MLPNTHVVCFLSTVTVPAINNPRRTTISNKLILIMGKVKKNHKKNPHRHNPLDQEILENRYARSSSRIKVRSKQSKDDEFIDIKLSSEILKQARQQKDDIEGETGFSKHATAPYFSLSSSDPCEDFAEILNLTADKVAETEIEVPDYTEEDEKALQTFLCNDPEKKQILTDLMKEKLTEKQTEIQSVCSEAGNVYEEDKASFLYRELAPVLHRYRNGKLPKGFNAIPKFTNWEQILNLTEPDKWTDAAMFQATRLFSSNLQDKMAQRFYNLFLLPRLRDEIDENKKLNFHLYQALKKALFKPAAFFKAMIIPLCKSGNCTLREATIFGSVLAKCSIPVLHSSAALLMIAEMDYNGVNSIFMRILIEKKYALPYRVVNAVVNHFLRFMDDSRQFPLLWHQCLLTFVQIYKTDLSPEQKASLLKLLTVHSHEHITPEIRKQLEENVQMTEVTEHL